MYVECLYTRLRAKLAVCIASAFQYLAAQRIVKRRICYENSVRPSVRLSHYESYAKTVQDIEIMLCEIRPQETSDIVLWYGAILNLGDHPERVR